MRIENIPREAWIALAILFMLATQNAGFFGLLFLVGMLFFARSMIEGAFTDSGSTSRRNRRSSQRRDSYDDYARDYSADARDRYSRVPPPADDVLEVDHVLEAITTAGHDPNELPVLPIDLGFLVYKDKRDPQMHRNAPIPDDADYVRPFVELELPAAVSGRIRFEILDSSGRSLFVDENAYQLKRGTQPIIAQTWLPIHDAQAKDGMWQVKVSADGVLLANHVFEWDMQEDAAAIRQHIQEDGEISAELRQAMAENRLQKMSLDELLADQDEADEQPQPQSRQQRR
jgi:hypothetical protein